MRQQLGLLLGSLCVLFLAGCASTPPTASVPPPQIGAMNAESGVVTRAGTSIQPERHLKITPLLSSVDEEIKVASVEPPTDLWERIRSGFAINDLSGPLVDQQQAWYVARPDYVERMVERSRKYLFHVVEELEARGMPTELALLPFVESAFNPQAVSTAKAAGMWQFIPSTGRHFELRQNLFRDDRRDVLASTQAALDYFQKLYAMFGDWQLVLAAYNWGEGNVMHAITRNARQGLPTDYSSLSMPSETQHYVPKLQAIKNIIAHPRELGVDLPIIANHPYFQAVSIDRDIDVSLAAELAQISVTDFKALNPAANKPLIIAAGTPKILLPWDNAAVFSHNLEQHTGALASWTAWRAPHTMKPNEAAMRAHMDESDFRSLNHIYGRVLIKAGSTLLIPREQHLEDDISEALADSAQLSLAPETVLRKKWVKARRNDNLDKIAKRYSITVAQLETWNSSLSRSSRIRTGQKIALFVPKSVTQARHDSRHGYSHRLAQASGRHSSRHTRTRLARGHKVTHVAER